MAQQQQPSVVGTNVFRELDGLECAEIFAHDLEQAIINMLATGEFHEKVMDWFSKTGRFNVGACYPVVFMQGKLRIKVYASVESARSMERMPPELGLTIEGIETGERKPDTELVTEAEVAISRGIGTEPANSVDRARLEVGLVPLVPARTNEGAVVNKPGKHAERAAGYQERFAKSKTTVEAKRLAKEAEAQTEAERERAAQESEARSQEPTAESGANLK